MGVPRKPHLHFLLCSIMGRTLILLSRTLPIPILYNGREQERSYLWNVHICEMFIPVERSYLWSSSSQQPPPLHSPRNFLYFKS